MTYKMVATRSNETIKSERSSAYITLSKARVWLSEGWTVAITDDDGKTFGVAEFESRVAETLPLPHESAIVPDVPISPEADAKNPAPEQPGAGAGDLVAV